MRSNIDIDIDVDALYREGLRLLLQGDDVHAAEASLRRCLQLADAIEEQTDGDGDGDGDGGDQGEARTRNRKAGIQVYLAQALVERGRYDEAVHVLGSREDVENQRDKHVLLMVRALFALKPSMDRYKELSQIIASARQREELQGYRRAVEYRLERGDSLLSGESARVASLRESAPLSRGRLMSFGHGRHWTGRERPLSALSGDTTQGGRLTENISTRMDLEGSVAVFFGDVSDGRHLFATLLDIFSRPSYRDTTGKVRMLCGDSRIEALARLLIVLHFLERDVDRELLYMILFGVVVARDASDALSRLLREWIECDKCPLDWIECDQTSWLKIRNVYRFWEELCSDSSPLSPEHEAMINAENLIQCVLASRQQASYDEQELDRAREKWLNYSRSAGVTLEMLEWIGVPGSSLNEKRANTVPYFDKISHGQLVRLERSYAEFRLWGVQPEVEHFQRTGFMLQGKGYDDPKSCRCNPLYITQDLVEESVILGTNLIVQAYDPFQQLLDFCRCDPGFEPIIDVEEIICDQNRPMEKSTKREGNRKPLEAGELEMLVAKSRRNAVAWMHECAQKLTQAIRLLCLEQERVKIELIWEKQGSPLETLRHCRCMFDRIVLGDAVDWHGILGVFSIAHGRLKSHDRSFVQFRILRRNSDSQMSLEGFMNHSTHLSLDSLCEIFAVTHHSGTIGDEIRYRNDPSKLCWKSLEHWLLELYGTIAAPCRAELFLSYTLGTYFTVLERVLHLGHPREIIQNVLDKITSIEASLDGTYQSEIRPVRLVESSLVEFKLLAALWLPRLDLNFLSSYRLPMVCDIGRYQIHVPQQLSLERYSVDSLCNYNLGIAIVEASLVDQSSWDVFQVIAQNPNRCHVLSTVRWDNRTCIATFYLSKSFASICMDSVVVTYAVDVWMTTSCKPVPFGKAQEY